MNINFNGKRLRFNLNKVDYSKYFGEVTDSLVQFDGETNTVTVDERASDSYARYAAIHECICCGRYRDLFSINVDPNRRCGEIDKMLLAKMPKPEREFYLGKRIEMFETLLNKNLNPGMAESFKTSLEMLKKLRDEKI